MADAQLRGALTGAAASAMLLGGAGSLLRGIEHAAWPSAVTGSLALGAGAVLLALFSDYAREVQTTPGSRIQVTDLVAAPVEAGHRARSRSPRQ